jgi:hypothetical protein
MFVCSATGKNMPLLAFSFKRTLIHLTEVNMKKNEGKRINDAEQNDRTRSQMKDNRATARIREDENSGESPFRRKKENRDEGNSRNRKPAL